MALADEEVDAFTVTVFVLPPQPASSATHTTNPPTTRLDTNRLLVEPDLARARNTIPRSDAALTSCKTDPGTLYGTTLEAPCVGIAAGTPGSRTAATETIQPATGSRTPRRLDRQARSRWARTRPTVETTQRKGRFRIPSSIPGSPRSCGAAPTDIDSYLDLWILEIEDAGNIPREEWTEYFDWLIENQIAIPEDRAEFDKRFTDTQRAHATPRPGISVARQWQVTDAENLDARSKLAAQIAEAFERMAAELGV